MIDQAIANGLYLELLFAAMTLLGILLINNLMLYKQKVNGLISLMLISGVVMCVLEIVWTFIDGNPDYKILSYLSAGGYAVSLIIFSAFVNLYLIDRFGIKLKKIPLIIFYALPVAITVLLCAATPWTHIMFRVDESGNVLTMEFFETVFHGIVYFYVFSPLLIAVYFLTIGKKRKPSDGEIPLSVFIFGAIAPFLYWLQLFLLDKGAEIYETSSIPVSMALVYLVTNVSTHSLLKTRAKVEATESELRVATDIQTGSLPTDFPDRPEFEIYAYMDPAKEVGGDFYDFFMIDDDHLALVIADVSGKGVPAALFMMSSKILINDHAIMGGSPAEILERVNKQVYANNKAHMFVTVWLGILEIGTGKLTTASAGHEYPMININGKYEMLKDKHGLAVGATGISKYKDTEIQLKNGDSIFVYTDGVAEATDANNELFGTDRTVEALNAVPEGASQQEVLAGVRVAVDAFVKEAPQFDDLTMVGLKYFGPENNAGGEDQ